MTILQSQFIITDPLYIGHPTFAGHINAPRKKMISGVYQGANDDSAVLFYVTPCRLKIWMPKFQRTYCPHLHVYSNIQTNSGFLQKDGTYLYDYTTLAA
jgi:hypothetical protein